MEQLSQREEIQASQKPKQKVETHLTTFSQIRAGDMLFDALSHCPRVQGNLQVIESIGGSRRERRFFIFDEKHVSLLDMNRSMHLLSLSDNPLYQDLDLSKSYPRLIAGVYLEQFSDTILYINSIEINKEFQGLGVGAAFYQKICTIARDNGFRFVTGIHDTHNIEFFLKQGAFLLNELQDVSQGTTFAPMKYLVSQGIPTSVTFLYPEDIVRHVRPEQIESTIIEKIELQKAFYSLELLYTALDQLVINADTDHRIWSLDVLELLTAVNACFSDAQKLRLPTLGAHISSIDVHLLHAQITDNAFALASCAGHRVLGDLATAIDTTVSYPPCKSTQPSPLE